MHFAINCPQTFRFLIYGVFSCQAVSILPNPICVYSRYSEKLPPHGTFRWRYRPIPVCCVHTTAYGMRSNDTEQYGQVVPVGLKYPSRNLALEDYQFPALENQRNSSSNIRKDCGSGEGNDAGSKNVKTVPRAPGSRYLGTPGLKCGFCLSLVVSMWI